MLSAVDLQHVGDVWWNEFQVQGVPVAHVWHNLQKRQRRFAARVLGLPPQKVIT
jgi:hypothetical protein